MYDPNLAPPPMGYEQPMPSYQGVAGYTAMGLGATTYAGQQMSAMAGGDLFGSNVASMAGSVPGMAYGAAGMVGLAAPFLYSGINNRLQQDLAHRAAGGIGMSAIQRAGWKGMYAGVKVLDRLDPTTYIGELMPMGWKAGRGIGAALGMGRAGSTALGLMGGASGIALPLAAGAAVAYGLDQMRSQIQTGATEWSTGRVMASQMHGAVPGANLNQGGGFNVRGLSADMQMDTDELRSVAQALKQMDVFRTSSDAKEFHSKLRDSLKAIKDIAKLTGETIQEATRTFGSMRQQGFYDTKAASAFALLQHGRSNITGIPQEVMDQVGQAGAQTARQYGMRGRFGADHASSAVTSVSRGVRRGTLSEEEIEEQGGVEAVGLKMARQQMGFLGTARGRAMIAYAMGENGAPDGDRLAKLLGGARLEDVVSEAAGRGLGVLQKAGTREAKEAMMPYAGASMLSMAMAQSNQIYGYTNMSTLRQMMGTMGIKRNEVDGFINQARDARAQDAAERNAQREATALANYNQAQEDARIGKRVKNWAYDNLGGDYLRDFGATTAALSSSAYTDVMRNIYGGGSYTTVGNARGKELMSDYLNKMQENEQDRRSGREPSHRDVLSLSRRQRTRSSWIGAKSAGEQDDVDFEKYNRYNRKSSDWTSREDVVARVAAARADARDEGVTDEQFNAFRAAVQGGSLERSRWDWSKGSKEFFRMSDDERSVVWGAQAAGVLESGTTLSDWENMDSDKREKIREKMRILTGRMDGTDWGGNEGTKKELSGALTSTRGDLLASADVERIQDFNKESTARRAADVVDPGSSHFLAAANALDTFTDPFGLFGGALKRKAVGAETGAFQRRLNEDGRVRDTYSKLLRAMEKDGASGPDYQQYLNQMHQMLTDDEKTGFLRVLDGLKMQMGKDPEKFKKQANEWSEELDAQSIGEVLRKQQGKLRSGLATIDRTGLSEGSRSAFDKLQQASGDMRQSPAALEAFALDLIGSVDEHGVSISGEEAEMLRKIYGEDIGADVNALMGGKADDASYKALGLDKKKLRGMAAGERAQAIMEALKKNNSLKVINDGEGDDQTSTEYNGVTADFVRANDTFVQSVRALLQAMKDNGIDVSNVPNPGK